MVASLFENVRSLRPEEPYQHVVARYLFGRGWRTVKLGHREGARDEKKLKLILKTTYWIEVKCSRRDLNPGVGLERPE